MLYNWSCHYTRYNLHLDLHHLAMMFLIQRSIYTLKEISLENNELIYHTVCSCVEHLSYWGTYRTASYIWPGTSKHFNTNTAHPIDWSTQHFKVPQAHFTVIDKELIYLTNELCITVRIMYYSGYGLIPMLALLANSHTASSKDQHSVYISFCQYLLGSDIHTIVFHVFCNNNLLFSINLA